MPTSKPTVVLVHGAWHDERCWAEVITQLRLRRIPAASLTLPSTDPGCDLPGFVDDVRALVDLVESIGSEVILCGHGYGGMVISEAGHHHQVSRLVYLAAFCPRPGERAVDQVARWPLAPAAPLIRLTGDGRMTIGPRAAARRLYRDLGAGPAVDLAGRLLPSTASIWRAPAVNPAWQIKPTTYVVCTRDRMIDGRQAQRTAGHVVRSQPVRGRSTNHALALASDHAPFYSAPNLVAEVIGTLGPGPLPRLALTGAGAAR